MPYFFPKGRESRPEIQIGNTLSVDLLYSRYDVGEVIGTGAFSEVRRAVERCSKTSFAIKIIDKSKCKGKENMIQSEVAILKRAKHPNIIRLFEMYESHEKIFLVMQLYEVSN